MNELRMHVEKLARVLGGFAYRYGSEVQLHERLATVLTNHGYAFEREVQLGPRDRLDFLVEGAIAIEVKVDGSASQALRQVARYAKKDEVHALLLASTESWADMTLKQEVRKSGWHGKPFAVVRLRRQAL